MEQKNRDTRVSTGTHHGYTTPPDLVSQLRSRLKGEVIAPQDAGYDLARQTFYGGFEHVRPAAIALPEGEEDVVQAVNYAREQGIELAVRSGGHNIAGLALTDGGIVLDLSAMRRLHQF
jgi:FAD/FMN-containing dehydrogenase